MIPRLVSGSIFLTHGLITRLPSVADTLLHPVPLLIPITFSVATSSGIFPGSLSFFYRVYSVLNLSIAMSESITLRSHFMGSLTYLVESASLGAIGKCSVICELVSLFVDYREEGTSLFLDVFVTNDLEQLITLIPQSSYLRLGSCTLDEKGVVSAVKKAAPLVRGSWKMYLSPNGEDLDFGVFRDSGHPLNVSVDFGLQSGEVGDAKFIRVSKLSQDAVKVSTHNRKQEVIHFSNAKKALKKFSTLSTLWLN